MLLPFCTNGIGHLQQKPWSSLVRSPFPISPITPASFHQTMPQFGLPAFRGIPGPCFPNLAPPIHNVITQQMLPRPTFPNEQQAATVTQFGPWPKTGPKCDRNSNDETRKKKFKIFRPWDDDPEPGHKSPNPTSSSTTTSPSSTTSNLVRCENPKKFEAPVVSKKSPRKIDDKITDPPQMDDAEQSKSAFEIFATNLGKSPDGHRCIYCGKMYSRKYGLKIHLRTHTGFKPLKCKVCQRPFGDPSNLNKHVRLHADVLLIPPQQSSKDAYLKKRSDDQQYADNKVHVSNYQLSLFKCPFCGRSLVRKRDLERHLASRHPNEQFVDVEKV